MPKIEAPAWTEKIGAPNPLFGQSTGPYAEITLGDALGLQQFGVRLERLYPGSRSSYRHWHEAEDEFVYVLSGELILVEDKESTLRAGDAAGWPAGLPVAHCLENRSSGEATFLVVGTRSKSDVVRYPDHDLVMRRDEAGRLLTHSDGSPAATSA